MAKSSLSSLQDACKTAALVNPKNYKKDKKGRLVPNKKIIGKLCPDNCNNRGRCVNGKCRCFKGYASSDCSVNKRLPPKLTYMQSKGMCDLRKRGCRFESMHGQGFWEGHINCHIQKARVGIGECSCNSNFVRVVLAAGREKEGELEYLHRKSRCEMVIGGDDISSDIITLGTCFSMFVYVRARFRFAMIGGNLTAQSMESPRRIGGGIQIPETYCSCRLSFLFPPCRSGVPESLLAG